MRNVFASLLFAAFVAACGGGGGGSTASPSNTASSPTITAFSPTSGTVGTSVTITGTNYDAAAANNTVKFNGAQAVVSSATSTQIVATVPATATTGPITVATAGGTATSSSDFTVLPGGATACSNVGLGTDFLTISVNGAAAVTYTDGSSGNAAPNTGNTCSPIVRGFHTSVPSTGIQLEVVDPTSGASTYTIVLNILSVSTGTFTTLSAAAAGISISPNGSSSSSGPICSPDLVAIAQGQGSGSITLTANSATVGGKITGSYSFSPLKDQFNPPQPCPASVSGSFDVTRDL